jgi:UDP-glucose:(heptosyl)LPS alpha-1,3-glucosyltransferase
VFGDATSTHIWYLGERTRDQYIRYYGTAKERFSYLPPGINKHAIQSADADEAKALRGQLGVTKEQRLLTMVGSDFKRKGVDRAIEAIASLPQPLRQSCILLVVGEGKTGKLKKLAQKRGLEQQIIFHGPSQQVPLILKAADYLLHPARVENTGNAILEGIVAGLGVLTTSNCGFAPHVEQAMCGVVCDGEQYSQNDVNQALFDLLKKDTEQLKNAALHYADTCDFYSRPQTAMKLIEEHFQGLHSQ